MHEEQIDQIMESVSMFGRADPGRSALAATMELVAIRGLIEKLVGNPSVTPNWHMIEDKDATYMIVNTNCGVVYCKGMDEGEAWTLVRRLNGIEE